jgi:antitoxin component of MazEF toxin-antitoxin module
MQATEAKVIKIGNSYGVRLPKDYMRRHGLKPGGTFVLPETPKGNAKKALAKMQHVAEKFGSMESIKDPVEWQRAIRAEIDPWHEVIRDIGR